MNIEETKKAIEVMQAYVEGKEIQYNCEGLNDIWKPTSYPDWKWGSYKYRIKEEPARCWVIWRNEKSYTLYANKEQADLWFKLLPSTQPNNKFKLQEVIKDE